jgi:hypothetical protein
VIAHRHGVRKVAVAAPPPPRRGARCSRPHHLQLVPHILHHVDVKPKPRLDDVHRVRARPHGGAQQLVAHPKLLHVAGHRFSDIPPAEVAAAAARRGASRQLLGQRGERCVAGGYGGQRRDGQLAGVDADVAHAHRLNVGRQVRVEARRRVPQRADGCRAYHGSTPRGRRARRPNAAARGGGRRPATQRRQRRCTARQEKATAVHSAVESARGPCRLPSHWSRARCARRRRAGVASPGRHARAARRDRAGAGHIGPRRRTRLPNAFRKFTCGIGGVPRRGPGGGWSRRGRDLGHRRRR